MLQNWRGGPGSAALRIPKQEPQVMQSNIAMLHFKPVTKMCIVLPAIVEQYRAKLSIVISPLANSLWNVVNPFLSGNIVLESWSVTINTLLCKEAFQLQSRHGSW